MTIDELHAMIEKMEPPFTVQTKGGQQYGITDRANIWTPVDAESLLCMSVRGEGLIVLRASAIESVQLEHDAAGAR